MADIVIENAYLLTMDPSRGDIENGAVVIEDGLVTEIGESIRRPAKKTIDARGCVVMPGLINTHCHIAMTIFRGFAEDLPLKRWLEDRIWPAESKITESEIRIGSLLGCLEMIKSGTTAFADMYFHMDETAKAVEESGLRASLCHGMMDLGDRDKADAELKEATRFAREWNGKAGGRISAMYGPHAPNTCSRDFLKRVKERAQEDGVGLHIHISETEAEHGPGPVKYLDELGFLGPEVLAAHCVWVSDDEIEILANRRVHVSHNAVSNMKLASGIAPVAKMLAGGVSVSLGTDGCASNNTLDLFEEMKTAALLQKVAAEDPTVLPVRQVLEMATVNGAAALGINSGMLKEGRNADVIVVDMRSPHLIPAYDVPSNLVYAAGGRDVRASIVAGTLLMEDYRVVAPDEEKILKEMNRLAKGLRFHQ